MDYKTQIRQALARGYCTPENEKKILDPVLIEAMTVEVLKSVGFIPAEEGVESDSNTVLCAEHDNTEGFKNELESLINKHSIENKCDVPDFILSDMVVSFIEAIGPKIKQTLDWHGCDSVCHPGA